MRCNKSARQILIAAGSLATGGAFAQDNEAAVEFETMEVLGVLPTHGPGLPRSGIPANVQSATSEDVDASQAVDIAEFLNRELGSVHINDAQNNPLQKDVQFRGFVASPLLGQAQGLSIYQDGVRLNEPFGDTVNWAAIPDSAIGSITLMPGSNPLFGRNTLGGALSIATKTGFTHPGTRTELYGGSFDRRSVQAETGGNRGNWGWFTTGEYFDEHGWRDFSPTEARKLFTNISWRPGEKAAWDLSVNLTEAELIGNGPAPVELLAQDREAIFTHPDRTGNDLAMFNLRGTFEASPSVLLTGNAYYRGSDTGTLNGDESNFRACSFDPSLACQDDDGDEIPATDPTLGPIPANVGTVGDVANGVPPGTNHRSTTEQDGYGATLQIALLQDLFGRGNQLVLGAEADRGDVDFGQSTELGRLDQTRGAIGSGFFVADEATNISTRVENHSLYFTDTLWLTEALAVTVSGRYNDTNVEIGDRSGLEPALDGAHDFQRFNPALGATYAFGPALTLFGGYSESSRAPTPSELTCADPDDPCRLPNAFLADPPLDEVVARTFEAGVRGELGPNLSYNVAAFNTGNENDILFITEGDIIGEGFFDNVGDTRRRGVELGFDGLAFERIDWFLNYTRLQAEFRENFLVASEEHEFANASGQIHVESGDRIPLIPEQIFKAGVDVRVLPNASLGVNVLYNGDQVLRGDESNQLQNVGSYTLVNLNGRYSFNDHIVVFGRVTNLFDEDYETFGLLGEEPGAVLLNDFENPRFLGPGAPRAFWIGLRASF
ncbi:TonB-dependent receptor [soil metagenome]